MKLKVLFIGGNPLDIELTMGALKLGEIEAQIKVIDGLENISNEIASNSYDIVLCDYALKGDSVLDLIKEIKGIDADLPVIIVSGTEADMQALEVVLAGAKDYILKDNFSRLVPAVEREYKTYYINKEKKQTNELLDALFNSPMGVRISDSSRAIVNVNTSYCEMMGYTKDELIGKNLNMLIPETRTNKDTKSFNSFIEGQEASKPTIFRDLKKDGSYIDLLVTSKVVTTGNDKFMVDTFQDITEMEQYRRLFEEASKVAKLGGWQINFITGKEIWSEQTDNILNFNTSSGSKISLKYISSLLDKNVKVELEDFLKQIKTGLPSEVELELKVQKDKESTRWLKLSAQPVIEHKKTVQAFGALQDITDEKLKNIAVERNENRFRFLFENSPNPKIVYDINNYSIIEVNKAACKLYGYTEEEFLQKSILELHPVVDRKHYLKNNEPNLSELNKTRSYYNIKHQKKNGDIILVDAYAKTANFDDKATSIVIINDTTEKYQAEQEIIELNAVLKNLIDSSPLAIVTLDREGRVDEVWNNRAEELFGWKKHEVLGKTIPYLPKGKKGEFNKNLKTAFSGVKNTVLEINRFTKEGKLLTLKLLTTPVEEKDGKVTRIMSLIEDVTIQKKAEQALIVSEIKYRQLVEAAHDLVWRMDKSGKFTFVNSASQEILNYSPAELQGKSFLDFISKGQTKELKDKISGLKKGENLDHFDLKMKKKDGSLVYMTGTMYPLIDADGAIVGSSGTATDITPIKVHQQQLEASLKEKEVLIKEIHHRVKNNLAVISGILGLQVMNMTDEATIAILEQNRSRIKSMSMIHERLYQKELFASVEIKSYLADLINEIKSSLRQNESNISIIVTGDEITLDMNQAVPFGILANELITNAFKFAFKGRKNGLIKLEIRNVGDKIFFSVSDDGIGLPTDFEKIKEKSLGLTLVKTVAKQLNGELTWGQINGKGTRFNVEFSQKDMDAWANK